MSGLAPVIQNKNNTPLLQSQKIKKLSDSFLTKTEMRKRIVFQKTISATDYLNGKYGVGKWSRSILWDKVNLYLSKDNLDPLPLSTYDRYRRELNNLVVDELKAFSCIGEGMGKERGATFLAMTHKDASYLINIFFYRKKMERQQALKLKRQREQKLVRHTVYCSNQLNLSSKALDPPKIQGSSVVKAQIQRRIGTDSKERPKEGSYTYQKALRSLETMGVLEEDLRVIRKKIWHPVTRENALINLSHFVAEFEEKDSRRAFEHFKHEIIYYQREMFKLKKDSIGYEKALKKVRNQVDSSVNIIYRPAIPYVAPTGDIDLEPVKIENPVLRELMEKLKSSIEAREKGT